MSTEPLKATADSNGDGVFIVTTHSGHKMVVDTDHVRNSAPTPMELLLAALGTCTAVDVVGILRKKRQDVTAYRVEVKGERRDEHPRSYERMQVHHIVSGRNISRRFVEQAIKLSEEKYCSVAATFRPTAEIFSTYEIIEDEDPNGKIRRQ